MPQRRSDRKEQILQSLAAMLESSPGSKITTAKLAASLDVSEAALYRHFPSKTRMYESLIDFVEETLFSRITQILSEESEQLVRCKDPDTLPRVLSAKPRHYAHSVRRCVNWRAREAARPSCASLRQNRNATAPMSTYGRGRRGLANEHSCQQRSQFAACTGGRKNRAVC